MRMTTPQSLPHPFLVIGGMHVHMLGVILMLLGLGLGPRLAMWEPSAFTTMPPVDQGACS